jgi:hypothetical protein
MNFLMRSVVGFVKINYCVTLRGFRCRVKFVLVAVRDKNFGLRIGTTGKHSTEINWKCDRKWPHAFICYLQPSQCIVIALCNRRLPSNETAMYVNIFVRYIHY